MDTQPYDPLAYVSALETAGVPAEQAKIHARTLGTVVDGMTTIMRNLSEGLHRVISRIDVMDADVKSVSAAVRTLEARLDSGFNAIDARMEALDGTIREMDGRVMAIDNSKGLFELKTGDRFDALTADVDHRFKALEARMNDRFAALETRMNDRFAALETHMNDRFAAQETHITDQLTMLETKLIIRIGQLEQRSSYERAEFDLKLRSMIDASNASNNVRMTALAADISNMKWLVMTMFAMMVGSLIRQIFF